MTERKCWDIDLRITNHDDYRFILDCLSQLEEPTKINVTPSVEVTVDDYVKVVTNTLIENNTEEQKERKKFTPWVHPLGYCINRVIYTEFRGKGRFHLKDASEFVSTSPLGYGAESASPALTTLKYAGYSKEANAPRGERGWHEIIDRGPPGEIDWSHVRRDGK